MAKCFICSAPATHKLTFEVPKQEPKSIGFCKICSERVGTYIRWRRRFVRTELVQPDDPAHAEDQ